MRKLTFAASAALLLTAGATAVHAGPTLDAVKDKGFIQCGVSQGLPGFSNPDDQGNWTGIDVDMCRATTWTLTRDTALGLNFTGVNYYDGQGFMVRKDLGISSALELDGAAVCTNTGTTTELNVADYFRANNLQYEVVAFEKADEVVADQSGLYAQRIKLANPDDHIILPEVISKEPLGPVVRHGDDEWFDIVKWSLNCMVNAEELGVSSDNVASMNETGNPEIRRLLGMEGDAGKNLGLPEEWCKNMIAQVGNYGESFARNLGGAPLNIERGINALWTQGGLMYAPPIR